MHHLFSPDCAAKLRTENVKCQTQYVYFDVYSEYQNALILSDNKNFVCQ